MKKSSFNEVSNFLRGEVFSPELVAINYNDIVQNFSNYIVDYWIKWRNGSHDNVSLLDDKVFFVPSFAGFSSNMFYNCHSLQVPKSRYINAFFVLLENKVYPLGKRMGNFDTITLIHAPNQLLLSGGSMKNLFPDLEKNNTYSMNFYINGVEKMRRRNKRRRPCMRNWIDYDSEILNEYAKSIGCTPPYINRIDSIPECTTQHQMQKSMFKLRLDDYGKAPPCQGFERVDFIYEENGLRDTIWSGEGKFWIGLLFNNRKFKEVVEKQAIDLNGLIGYVGGYIGLILGYSIVKIPESIIAITWKFKRVSLQDLSESIRNLYSSNE